MVCPHARAAFIAISQQPRIKSLQARGQNGQEARAVFAVGIYDFAPIATRGDAIHSVGELYAQRAGHE